MLNRMRVWLLVVLVLTLTGVAGQRATRVAVAVPQGDVSAWGWDSSGQLGDDATLADKPTPSLWRR
jgi:hypothetical protein